LRILLTNDDGFEAEGLQCLFKHLSEHANCFVVAPDQGRSCCGHAVTTGDSIRVEERHPSGWAVSGTPADCVRIGLRWLKLQPDLVISGVNHGGNLGVDIAYSGTVAAAREARMMGVPSIAVSQYMRRDVERDWNVNAMRAVHVIQQVLKMHVEDEGFWSINLPALSKTDLSMKFPITQCEPELQSLDFSFANQLDEETHIDKSKASVLYSSNYQLRPRTEDRDVGLCFAGHATVSWLRRLPFLDSKG